MKIKWGIIGCGGIAYRRTIPGMMLCDNAELVAVMDTNLEIANKVKDEFNAKYAFDKAQDLLALDEIDAVYIATPVFCHKEQVFLTAKAKKHILLEKPMGLTVADSKEIANFCKAEGVKLGVGLMMRFSAYHQKMKELIANGTIGNVVSMRAQLTCWYPEIEGNWRQNVTLSGGGALMDMGIHCIDLLQYISGTKAKTVASFTGNQTFNYSADDSSAVILQMDSGATAFVDSNFNIPDNAAKCRLEFYGTKGSILAEGTISQVEGGVVQLITSDPNAVYDAKQDRNDNTFTTLSVDLGNMYQKEILSFSNAILNDTDPEITADEGIFVQTVVQKAYESSKDGVFKTI